jgi:hypothetical protein
VKLYQTVWLVFLTLTCAMGQTTRYVATTGSDTDGDGSAGNPWLTISNGVFQAAAGDTLLVATGRYEVAAAIRINKHQKV